MSWECQERSIKSVLESYEMRKFRAWHQECVGKLWVENVKSVASRACWKVSSSSYERRTKGVLEKLVVEVKSIASGVCWKVYEFENVKSVASRACWKVMRWESSEHGIKSVFGKLWVENVKSVASRACWKVSSSSYERRTKGVLESWWWKLRA